MDTAIPMVNGPQFDEEDKGIIEQAAGAVNNMRNDPEGALKGFANSVLFGIPEQIAKVAVGDEVVKKFMEEHRQAYEPGGALGAVAGGFIPVAGVAGKALQGASKLTQAIPGVRAVGNLAGSVGRGLEMASGTKPLVSAAGRDLARFTPAGQVGVNMLHGATNAAADTALRGYIAGDEDTLGKAAQSAVMGGALGGALGALSRGRELTGELEEALTMDSAKAFGVTNRMLKKEATTVMGGGRRAGKEGGSMADFMRRFNKFIHDEGLTPEQGQDEMLGVVNDSFARRFKAVEDRYPAISEPVESTLIPKFTELMEEIAKKPMLRTTKADLLAYADELKGSVTDTPGLVGKKTLLSDEYLANRDIANVSRGDEARIAGIKADLANTMIKHLDGEVSKALEATGDKAIVEAWNQALRDYPLLLLARKVITLNESGISGGSGSAGIAAGGSAAGLMLQGNLPGAAAALGSKPMVEKLSELTGKAVGKGQMLASRKMIDLNQSNKYNQFMEALKGKLDTTPAGPLTTKAALAAGGANAMGMGGQPVADPFAKTVTPAAGPEKESGVPHTPATEDLIAQRAAMLWNKRYAFLNQRYDNMSPEMRQRLRIVRPGEPSMDNPNFKKYMEGIYERMQGIDGVDPEIYAGFILGDKPELKKEFLELYQADRIIQQNIGQAYKPGTNAPLQTVSGWGADMNPGAQDVQALRTITTSLRDILGADKYKALEPSILAAASAGGGAVGRRNAIMAILARNAGADTLRAYQDFQSLGGR
jgi:hypothetical protein